MRLIVACSRVSLRSCQGGYETTARTEDSFGYTDPAACQPMRSRDLLDCTLANGLKVSPPLVGYVGRNVIKKYSEQG